LKEINLSFVAKQEVSFAHAHPRVDDGMGSIGNPLLFGGAILSVALAETASHA
jgi:hypothetical protein